MNIAIGVLFGFAAGWTLCVLLLVDSDGEPSSLAKQAVELARKREED